MSCESTCSCVIPTRPKYYRHLPSSTADIVAALRKGMTEKLFKRIFKVFTESIGGGKDFRLKGSKRERALEYESQSFYYPNNRLGKNAG